MFMLSVAFGGDGYAVPTFSYRFIPSGNVRPFVETPTGFQRGYQQRQGPLSVNFPGYFSEVKWDEETDQSGEFLVLSEKMGDTYLSSPAYYSFDTYYQQKVNHLFTNLWQQKVAMTDSSFFARSQNNASSASLEIIGADIAGQKVSLRIRGLITITGKYNQQNNSIVTTGNTNSDQKNFLMDQTQQFTIEGKIGDRITVSIDEDSQSDFDFENNIKIDYKGTEDEIFQSAHFGNISLSLPGTKYVTGSSSSGGLFGGKALMKLGPIDVTAIASYEKKESNAQSWGGSTSESGSTIKIYDYEYKRNTYFYLDEYYREKMYPYNSQTGSFASYDMLRDYDIYISCLETNENKQKAVAFVDLKSDGSSGIDASQSEDVADSIYFRKLTKPTTDSDGEYEINTQLGYIRLNLSVNDDNVLAIAYRTNSGKQYGDLLTGKYLKIIKPENPKPTYKTWDLEMKNIYDLKARDINSEGFELKIMNNVGNNPEEYLDGVPYLRYFGLDNFDQNGAPGHDGLIDVSPSGMVVDLERGEVRLPFVRPFQASVDESGVEGIYNDSLRSEDDPDLPSIPEIYDKTISDPLRPAKKYYLEVSYTNQSSTIDLGEMFIIEDSEELYVNGKLMTRGDGYDIDYFSGRITLKSAEALDPSAEIDVNYETEQLFGGIGETKMMAGMRAEYKIDDKNFLGATAMYYSRSVLDDNNVNIGDEPYRNIIWDVNGEFEYDLYFLNRALNALPMIYMKKASTAKISAEVAQILPNPNTISNEESGDLDGVAKLDDFESSNQETPLNISFQEWTPASKPENTLFHASFPERGFLFWYNPFYVDSQGDKTVGIYTKSIWPDKQTTDTDQYTTVMNMVLDPEVNGLTGLATNSAPKQMWGGVMQPIYVYDQSNSKYIEIWAKGEKGQVQIDIGEITEDYYNNNYDANNPSSEFGDGEKNYEDQNDNTSLDITTETSEDIGINGLTDEQEIQMGWDPNVDNFDKEAYSLGQVRHCNGTEGNAGTDGIQPYPETEDIDGDGKLDQSDSYYSYLLDLESEEYKVSETIYNDKLTGWKQYQIPLTDIADSVGVPSFMSIRTMRLSYFGVADQDTVQFASISIVGNEWQEIGVSEANSETFRKDDDKFFITVKNTDENTDYKSPPGITGNEQINTLDGSTIIEKEQALVMNIDGLMPGECAVAQKIMLESETLLMYKRLKMFIHGDDSYLESESQAQAFLRLGRGDMTEYYEATTGVYPGWSVSNNIDMIFEEITQLKLMTKDEFDNDTYFYYEDGPVKEYRPKDDDGNYTGKIYRVVGDPSLSRVEILQLGIINDDSFREYTGEIWINEMRVSETNNDPGMAMRGSFDFNLGGLMKFNANANSQDANFHQVNQQTSSSQNNIESYNLNMTIFAHELLPKKWRVKLPITMSQKDSRTTPKYYPGSDIILGDDVNDSLKVLSTTRSISSSYSRTGTSKDPALLKYLINPLKASFSSSEVDYSSLELSERQTITTRGNLSYGLKLNKGKGIKLFSWIPFLDKKSKETQFFWYPQSFTWALDLNEKSTDKITRTSLDTTSSYAFSMKRKVNVSYKPFNTMTWTYTRNNTSDLQDYRENKWLLFNDITYDSLMNGVNVGNVSNIGENISVNYNPKITSWLTPTLSYSSSYTYKSLNSWDYANVANTRNMKANVSLSPLKIWQAAEKSIKGYRKNTASRKETRQPEKSELQQRISAKDNAADPRSAGNMPPPKKGSSVPPKKGNRPVPEKKSVAPARTSNNAPSSRVKNQKNEGGKGWKLNISLKDIVASINPIRLTYSQTVKRSNNGIFGTDTSKIFKDVSYTYRYGLGNATYLPVETFNSSISSPFSNTDNISITARSGVKISKNMSLSLDYKQSSNSGRQYQFKTQDGDYYNPEVDIITNQDTLTLMPYDSSYTRNFLALGYDGKSGIPLPNYSLNWRFNVSQISWLRDKIKFIKTITLNHRFSGSEKISYQYNTSGDNLGMNEELSNYTISFSPLIKANIMFTGNLRTDIGYNKSIKIDNDGDVLNDYTNTSITQTYSDNVSMNVSYTYNKGLTIPVPFLKIKTLQLDNNITFSMTGKYGTSQKIVKEKTKSQFNDPKTNKSTWEIAPQLSYQFSKNIEGQVFFKYGQSIDKTKMDEDGSFSSSDYKDFGLTVKIRISG